MTNASTATTHDLRQAIADQIRRSLEGDSWHGPAVLEALAGVTATAAAARPLRDAHTIWEIVRHLAATYHLVVRRAGGESIRLTPDEDWPPIADESPEAWDRALAELRWRNAQIRNAVLQFPEGRLNQPLVASTPETALTQFVGIAVHDAYHAGQIVLLRRAVRAASRGP